MPKAAITDELNFHNANNSCMSMRIIAERLRAGDASMVIARDCGGDVLELKIAMGGFWLSGTAKREPTAG